MAPSRKASPLSQDILMIADALAYKRLDRLRQADTVSDDVLLDILKSSITEPFAILFFPAKCFQITPYGLKFGHILSYRDADYLIAFPELDEKFLRQAFTGFEFVIYKICHLVLEDQNPEYRWETQSTRQRFRRLKPILSLSDWNSFYELFDNLFFVRDAFAHSFIELSDIKYDGVRLGDCFGDSHVGHTRRDAETAGARIFTDDLATIFSPIMKLFCEHQLKQIDAKKFHKLCDRLLIKRSLSP
jgi:hypothetical protein